MYPSTDLYGNVNAPPVQAWSGWPVEWSMPNWGQAAGGLGGIVDRISIVFGAIDLNASILSTMPPYRMKQQPALSGVLPGLGPGGGGMETVAPLPWMINPQPEVYTGWAEALKQVVFAYFNGEAYLWATSRYADGTVKTWVMLNSAWVDVEQIGQTRRYFMAWGRNHRRLPPPALQLLARRPARPRPAGGVGHAALWRRGDGALPGQPGHAGRHPLGCPDLSRQPDQAPRPSTLGTTSSSCPPVGAMGAPAVLSGGITLTPLTITPKDMALLELRQFDEARISTLLGVPPMLLALPDGPDVDDLSQCRGRLRLPLAGLPQAQGGDHRRGHLQLGAAPSTQTIELNRDEYVRGNHCGRAGHRLHRPCSTSLDPVTGKRAMTIDEIREAEHQCLGQPSTPPARPRPLRRRTRAALPTTSAHRDRPPGAAPANDARRLCPRAWSNRTMSEADDVEAVLAQVIDLGGRPTQQQMDLGEAVAATGWSSTNWNPSPVCPDVAVALRAGRIRTPGGEEYQKDP